MYLGNQAFVVVSYANNGKNSSTERNPYARFTRLSNVTIRGYSYLDLGYCPKSFVVFTTTTAAITSRVSTNFSTTDQFPANANRPVPVTKLLPPSFVSLQPCVSRR